MWVYILDRESQTYEVGFFRAHELTGNQTWEGVQSCGSKREAEAKVNYLNGGTGQGFGLMDVTINEA